MSPKQSFPVEEILRQFEIGRDGATRIMAGSQPFHGNYNRARDIVMEIDELVEVLTGDRERGFIQNHTGLLAVSFRRSRGKT